MKQFIAKFEEHIEGTLSGFDRVAFRGSLRGLRIPTACACTWCKTECCARSMKIM
jgi:hypothetical protein